MILPFQTFNNDFEKLVLTLLEKKCSSLSKRFYLKKEAYLHAFVANLAFEFDAYAPDGIKNNKQTYIEVIDSQDINKIQQEISKRLRSFDFPTNYFLFVVPVHNYRIHTYTVSRFFNGNVEIWGIEEINELIREFPIDYASLRYYESIINPRFKIPVDIPRQTPPSIDSFKKNNNDLLKELKDEMRKNKLTLVLGSGVSMPYNSKMDWDKLVNSLYDFLETENLFSKEGKETAFKLIGSDNFSKSQYVKMVLKDDYTKALFKTLYQGFNIKMLKNDTSLACCANLIERTRLVKKVITYNYDDFLEMLLKERGVHFNSLFSINDSLTNDLPIYHVHGYLPKNAEKLTEKQKKLRCKELVLTEDEYFKCYSNSLNWQVAIQLISFKDDCCLLVGNSATDFNEKKLLHETIGSAKNRKARFAILPMNGLSENDLLKIYSYFDNELGVKVIWADNIEDIGNKINSLL